MQITAPLGYGEIVPLQKNHRVLVPAGNTPAFCRTLNALAVSVSEFVPAARDYPVVFASVDAAKTYAPVIVLGISADRNLFVGADGEWEAGAYFPAFVRRYPFCISKLYVDGEARSDRVVCVARSHVDESGIELFDASGVPTERWTQTERLLADFEDDLDRTARFCAALSSLALLEPFTMQVVGGSEPTVRLQGMYRVAEERLKDLNAASHKALALRGFTGLVHAHLHSLSNFARLHARSRADQARASRR